MEEDRGSFKILTGKPTGKRPLGRPMLGLEDNIGMDLKKIGIEYEVDLELLESPWNAALNLRVP